MKTFWKYYIWVTSIILFGLITGCLSKSPRNNHKILVEIKGAIDTSLIKAGSGVSITMTKKKMRNTIKMECIDINPVPRVTFNKGQDKWDLRDYKFLAADITNPGKENLLVECRPDEIGWLGGAQIIPAGKTRTVRAYILRSEGEYPSYLDKKLYGMDALPGGIIKSFWWSRVPVDAIRKLSIVLINPPKNSTILISNLRAEGSINPPTEAELNGDYFPLLDEFGQLRLKEWKGKIHSLSELISAKDAEKQDMIANTEPVDWNIYGGWLKGPQLRATGYFRTEKVQDKWWLVDPQGRLFWSHGMASVNMGNSTPISGREHYFTNLPDTVQFKDFYTTSTRRIPKGYYKGENVKLTQFKSYAWNLYKKYGENWESEYQKLSHVRLKSWGMNTIGNFSEPV